MPAPSVLDDGLPGYQGRAEGEDAPDLGIHVRGAQVQVQAVLLAFVIAYPLQQDLDARAAFRDQAAVRPAGDSAGRLSQHGAPEPCRTVQVRAVDDDDEFTIAVGLRHFAHAPHDETV